MIDMRIRVYIFFEDGAVEHYCERLKSHLINDYNELLEEVHSGEYSHLANHLPDALDSMVNNSSSINSSMLPIIHPGTILYSDCLSIDKYEKFVRPLIDEMKFGIVCVEVFDSENMEITLKEIDDSYRFSGQFYSGEFKL